MRTCDKKWQPLQKNVTRNEEGSVTSTNRRLAQVQSLAICWSSPTPTPTPPLPLPLTLTLTLTRSRCNLSRSTGTASNSPTPTPGPGPDPDPNPNPKQVQSLAIYWDSEEAGAGWQVGLVRAC